MIEIHEAANIFPLDEASIPALAEDIRTQGQQVPIERYAGKLIDGRRRLRACELAGVEPVFRDVTPADPIAYVLSLNLHRRQLTPSQAAMVGARAREVYELAAKERQKEAGKKHGRGKEQVQKNSSEPVSGGQARDLVGKAVGVSGFTIDCATKVLAKAEPELVKAVDEGRVSVSKAAQLVEQPRDVQVQEAAVADGHRLPRPKTVEPPAVTEPKRAAPADPERARRDRAKALELAQGAIDLLRKIGRTNAAREEAFRMVRTYMKANPCQE